MKKSRPRKEPEQKDAAKDESCLFCKIVARELEAKIIFDTDATCGTSQGDPVKKIDAVGNTTCLAYDSRHRPTSVTYSGPYSSSTPNKYFVYDAATVNSVAMTSVKSRMAEAYTATSSTGTKITDIGLSYSVRGEASDVYESTPHSGGYFHTSATYWANGTLDVLTAKYGTSNITGLPTFTYAPDGEGRINTVSASAGQNPVTGTTYSVASLPTQVNFGSSDSDSFMYDSTTNRLTQYEFTVDAQSVVGKLTWNSIGTLETLAITDPFYGAGNQTCTYSHDDVSRIASANCGSVWSQTFTYDAFGNISKSGTVSFQPTYSYLTNRMTMVGSSTPNYDANGNATNDTAHTYAWDANGRPVTADSVTLTYDALGRMAEQDKSGTYYQIVYAPMGSKFAIMNSSTLQKAFVPLTGGSQAVYTSSGLAYYRHSDWVGSSRFASTPTRTMYYDGAYAPFGEAYAQTGTADLSFTGMNQDTTANLYDFPAREFNDIHGRWPSPDPAGISAVRLRNPQSWNRYAYVMNSPLNATDPSGLSSFGLNQIGGAIWLGGNGSSWGSCIDDGVIEDCGLASAFLASGGAVQCPNNDCGLGSATPYHCADSVCGYMSNEYVATHENEVNGQLLTDSQYQDYLAATYPDQISAQYNRVSADLAALFGGSISADPDNPDVEGGNANFALDCGGGPCPSVGRYDDGIHIECASGGYGCAPGDPLVVHDDTVSPWTGAFSFSSIFSANFWEHGIVDVVGGTLCNCVLP
jgi:RHS repeat-associated protein